MRVLIVDDEELIREKIRRIISESQLSLREVLTAESAYQAMELMGEECPKIVISDIRMPKMSGLELAEYMKKNAPDSIVILISGYSDFEYAQSAIRQNVFDYILKPLEEEKLIATVLRAKSELESREKHQRLYTVFQEFFSSNIATIKKQYIENLLFCRGSIKDADSYKQVFEMHFSAYRLVAVNCSTAISANRLEGSYYCTYLMERYIQELLPQTITYIFGNLVFFIWELQSGDSFADNKTLLALLGNVQLYSRKNLFGNIYGAVSAVSGTLGDIQNLRRQTSDCLDYMQENGLSNFLFYDDFMNADSGHWENERSIQELIAVVRTGNKGAALALFDTIAGETGGETAEYIMSTALLVVSNISFVLHELGLDAASIHNLTNAILQKIGQRADPFQEVRIWLSEVFELISKEFQSRSNTVVSCVMDFIAAHYQEPIGLVEASRHVGRNPSYISRLIREHTGQGFTQLLTDRRVGEAKQLLKNTSMKIADISEQVGYCNVRYFNRVFKSVVNMSANDYRNFSAAFKSC